MRPTRRPATLDDDQQRIRRTHEHLLLLIKSATERVAAFLLEMATRMPTADQVDLPMSRQDIADYLGLTIETVSRTLTDLENKKVISLQSSRRVVLRNRFELSRTAASTALADSAPHLDGGPGGPFERLIVPHRQTHVPTVATANAGIRTRGRDEERIDFHAPLVRRGAAAATCPACDRLQKYADTQSLCLI